MSNVNFLPIIEPIFDSQTENANDTLYHKAIQNSLLKILPHQFFHQNGNEVNFEEAKDQFHSHLPFIKAASCGQPPANMSFYALSKYRPNAFKFFFDVISAWLVPGNRLNVVLIYAVDFRLPQFGDDVYTLCEVMVRVESPQEKEQILNNLPIIERELHLGMESSYYARRILEIKGLSSDQKTASIQEYIAWLVGKLPMEFDPDILTEMQHVLVICPDEFKAIRKSRHLSRIIGIHYLFRKRLKDAIKLAPKKRHLSLKIFKSKLQTEAGNKQVLSLTVAVNFLQDKEVFEERHLLKAIQNYIPSAQAVLNSFFANKRAPEHICTLYLEIEKTNGESFNSDEINLLRRELPSDLMDRIEHLMHPVFMPRNEEEIIRNILSLSYQIKYLRDIPQVFISFDEQTHSNLFFTIILVRILRPGNPSIQELFKSQDSFLEYIHDRCQNAGNLRRKYKKEATVFRVKFPKEQFLRRDHSIDLNKARQAVVSELSRVVGEIRDFNGGMISKQNELLCEVRHLLEDNEMKYNDLLLENFFYSLTPVIMRTVLEPRALRSLFFLLLKSIEQGFINGENYSISLLKEPQFAYVMVKTEDRALKDLLSRSLAKLQLHSSELAGSFVSVYDITYLGYIYRCDEPSKQHQFCHTIQSTIIGWNQKKKPS